ncbi:MAG: tyrosine--tRNA ligase [Candidatus Yanofskybacteria bacterium]|nr:tyrosine--tRNA ligase [Candidatus Yanofskybacteria bacterium]
MRVIKDIFKDMFGSKVKTDEKKINEILNRGVVAEILPSKEEFVKRLMSGDKLRIYIGADPTSDSLHLSHAKNYLLLEELRQLGHEVIVLVGDFTAQIGDPTSKESARTQLTEEQVKKNVKSWIKQIKPLMSFNDRKNPPRIKYNSEWLSKMSWKDELVLASNFTVQRMLERDMFDRRLKNDIPIYFHEFQYPLMQGYDSVAMDVDVELCGTDQVFNALVGRTLLKRLKNKNKFVVAVNLMENPKTKELMSKSKGTGVFLSSPPKEMFGAIMAQPDEMTEVLFINVTRIPLAEKEKIMSLGPREAKMLIAQDIVKKFYGEKEAQKAKDEWEKVFSKKELPEDIKEAPGDNMKLVDFMTEYVPVASSSEAKRLLDQGAVSVNEGVVKEWGHVLKKGDIVRIGPRKFLKVS